jgi:hypothetical protein
MEQGSSLRIQRNRARACSSNWSKPPARAPTPGQHSKTFTNQTNRTQANPRAIAPNHHSRYNKTGRKPDQESQ